ncbi:MAG: hypothetical protein IPG04_40890 [Polyangiaceae bacterium]|nr:hypothetical protein [Polyangiaceae bacterium]
MLQEDMTGASYHALCHYDADGVYADEVDTTYLPPTSGEASAEARRIALAKMHALARRRGDLVRAFNATFPDIEIDDPSTEDPTDTVNLQTAMMAFSQRLAALYESNPYDPSLEPEPLAPKTTRSLGDVFEAVGVSLDAKAMLTRMWARRGYRPSNVGLGAMRSTLAYPDLRDFTTSAVGLLGPLGPANPELRQLLAVLKQKMATMTPETSGLPPLGYSGPAQPNRPRTTIEALREIMLTEDERFAPYADVPPRYIAVRDRRGYAVPTTLTSTFFDGDGDGLADVDGFGRFIDASGTAVQIDTPFSIPGQPTFGSFDEFGRATSEPYVYVDTSRTPAASLSTVLTPLLDATEYADPADPNAFMSEYETLMYALAGMNVLFGPREEAEYDFEADQVVPVGTGCATCMRYSRFRGEDSPLVDLVYATGQIIGDKDSDVLLLGLIDLAENHEPELARLIAAALRVKGDLRRPRRARRARPGPAGRPRLREPDLGRGRAAAVEDRERAAPAHQPPRRARRSRRRVVDRGLGSHGGDPLALREHPRRDDLRPDRHQRPRPEPDGRRLLGRGPEQPRRHERAAQRQEPLDPRAHRAAHLRRLGRARLQQGRRGRERERARYLARVAAVRGPLWAVRAVRDQ